MWLGHTINQGNKAKSVLWRSKCREKWGNNQYSGKRIFIKRKGKVGTLC